MAIFRPGPMIADIRGSINGVTYLRTRAGLVARQRVSPINRQTPRQVAVRNAVAYLQEYWRTLLTPELRQPWEDLGTLGGGNNALGDHIRMTGVQMFIRTNVLLILRGYAIVTASPAPPSETSISAPTFLCTAANGLTIETLTPAIGASEHLFWQISPLLPQSRNFYKGPWEELHDMDSVSALPYTIIAPPGLAIGNRVVIRIRQMDAVGRLSVAQTWTNDCLA